VEFTQHTADEMYRRGRGWAPEWTKAEAATVHQEIASPLCERG
jgi:hypothetical protein